MNSSGLSERDIELINSVFRRHPQIKRAALFGSRAKGSHRPGSDVDLALYGGIDHHGAEEVAGELEELPLPYHFDVVAFDSIKLDSLREHIERVGVTIYGAA